MCSPFTVSKADVTHKRTEDTQPLMSNLFINAAYPTLVQLLNCIFYSQSQFILSLAIFLEESLNLVYFQKEYCLLKQNLVFLCVVHNDPHEVSSKF